MGQFRKTYDRRENSTPYFYSNTSYHYYYDEEIPDRLTLIQSCHDNIDFTTFSKLIYEYHDFADYRQVIENEYFKGWENYWEEDGYVLQYTTTYTYNLQDKLLERETVSFEEDGTESGTQRFVYGYDEKGNVVLMEIYQSWTDAEPYEATTYDYDAQNRQIHSQTVRVGNTVFEDWQTWGNHSLPDSTYTRDGYYITIQQNFFDSNEVRYLSKVWKNRSQDRWERTDTYYSYITAHQMHFPLMQNRFIGLVSSLDAPFVPTSTFTMNFFYSDDYHKASVSKFGSDDDTVYNDTFTYDDNWLLTRGVVRSPYWFSPQADTHTCTWEYYGPTPNDDPVAVPPAMLSAYPNPAKGMMNISLSKRDVRSPVEAKIYNIKGQLVRSLEVNDKSSDRYLYNWDCRDSNSRSVPAGVYLIRIKTNSGEVSKKVTVLK